MANTTVRLSSTEQRKRFFYGEADAPLYDEAVNLNTPLYGLVNETLITLFQNHFGGSSTRRHQDVQGYFLDIGSGTGAQSLSILEKFPNLHCVALDLCEPMHTIFEQKAVRAFGRAAFEKRCTLITGDIMSPAGTPRSLLKLPAALKRGEKYKAVVTAFALHHLNSREKQRAYRRIASVLEPGGLFVNADLFSFQSPSLSTEAHKFTIDYINKQHTEPDPEFSAAFKAVGASREHLRKAWVRHCNKFNIVAPIESRQDSLSMSKLSGPGAGQARMLLNAGFAEVGCPLRYWQVGILWGRK